MMQFSKGQRVKLQDLSQSKIFTIKVIAQTHSNITFDISCFGLDEFDKCTDERYFIFYNQKQSPCNSIILSSNSSSSGVFKINISTLPNNIKKLIFTITIDGEASMSQLASGSLLIFDSNSNKVGEFFFTGSDFDQEKAVMLGEIYFRDVWRFSAIGQGFNGGLSALLEHFGIEEQKEENNLAETTNPPSVANDEIENNTSKTSRFLKGIFDIPIKYTEKRKNFKKFKEKLKDCLADGVLTLEEMNDLEHFCNENDLKLQTALKESQREIEFFLHGMLADIVSDNIVTENEESSLRSVCQFLNPSENLQQEIWSVIGRVKLIDKIKNGHTQPIGNHHLVTKIDEIVWHRQSNIKLIRKLAQETKLHRGEFFVTSERLIFKSNDYPVEILLKNIIDIESSVSRFYVVGKTQKSTCEFSLTEGDIFGAYVNQALNKFHRKLNIQQTAKKTRSISQSVKQAVWLRDNGQCVECDATDYLEFDHIIPFSKGGSNSENNIQLLCRRCNLKKSDNI